MCAVYVQQGVVVDGSKQYGSAYGLAAGQILTFNMYLRKYFYNLYFLLYQNVSKLFESQTSKK